MLFSIGKHGVTLEREFIKHPTFHDPLTLKVFLWCLLEAEKTDEARVPFGTFDFGTFEAALTLKTSSDKLVETLLKLRNGGLIDFSQNQGESYLSTVTVHCDSTEGA